MDAHVMYQQGHISPLQGRKNSGSFSGRFDSNALFSQDQSPLPVRRRSSVCLAIVDDIPEAVVNSGETVLLLRKEQLQTIKSLLLRIWPKQRTVVGLRTCKWLRAGLIARTNDVMELHAKGHQGIVDVDEDEIVKDLQRTCHWKKQIAFKCGQKTRKIDSSIRLTLFSALTTAVPSLQSSLVEIDLSAWGAEITGALWGMLAEALGECKGLECLDVSQNEMGDESAVKVVAALGGCERLRRLNLAENQVGVENLEPLASALGRCMALEELDVSRNPIGNDGLLQLLPAIRRESLVKLSVEKVSVLGHGLQVLSDLLAGCPSLTHLSIKNNRDAGQTDRSNARLAFKKILELTVLNRCCQGLEEGMSSCSLVSWPMSAYARATRQHNATRLASADMRCNARPSGTQMQYNTTRLAVTITNIQYTATRNRKLRPSARPRRF
eukprot:1969479-Rhodomonas_salina.1